METVKRKKKAATHSSVTHIQSYPVVDDARAATWSAVIRGALVKAYLAETGNWVVMINELAGESR